MSEQQDKNIEQLAQETAAAGESLQTRGAAEGSPDAGGTGSAATVAPPPATRGSPALAWIALLLVLVVAGALGWSVWDQQRRDAGITARVQVIEATADREVAGQDEMIRRWQDRLESVERQLQAGRQSVDALSAKLGQTAETVDTLGEQVAGQRTALAQFSANDLDSWLLAEVQYLLRLASQRLLMAGDPLAAQGLLASADQILLELDDPRLHEVRAAVAADLAALRAVPRIDVEGVYLRLAALVEQAGKLAIFQLPERAESPAPTPAEHWQERLRQGYEAALAKLSNYIIIRRRDMPVQALMDPQRESLVRQNLRMLLEQAQIALLSGNEMLYRESLRRAQHWVGEFFESDEAAARAMAREIAQLADITIAASLPDISRSIQTLDAVMKQRLQPGGAG